MGHNDDSSAPGGAVSTATEAHVEIQQLVHRYADAVVHRNGVQWTSTWAADAVWDLGQGRLVEGIEAIGKLWYGAMGGFEATIQTVLNGATDLGDDETTATGRWYIQELYIRADGTTGILVAHYDDAYRKVDGGWRFTRRFLQPHYAGSHDLTAPFQCSADMLRERGAEGVDV